jgi:hypothetical protein
VIDDSRTDTCRSGSKDIGDGLAIPAIKILALACSHQNPCLEILALKSLPWRAEILASTGLSEEYLSQFGPRKPTI